MWGGRSTYFTLAPSDHNHPVILTRMAGAAPSCVQPPHHLFCLFEPEGHAHLVVEQTGEA